MRPLLCRSSPRVKLVLAVVYLYLVVKIDDPYNLTRRLKLLEQVSVTKNRARMVHELLELTSNLIRLLHSMESYRSGVTGVRLR